jgi:hypothetical protein
MPVRVHTRSRVHVHMNLYLGNRYRMTARSVTRANHMFSNTLDELGKMDFAVSVIYRSR